MFILLQPIEIFPQFATTFNSVDIVKAKRQDYIETELRKNQFFSILLFLKEINDRKLTDQKKRSMRRLHFQTLKSFYESDYDETKVQTHFSIFSPYCCYVLLQLNVYIYF